MNHAPGTQPLGCSTRLRARVAFSSLKAAFLSVLGSWSQCAMLESSRLSMNRSCKSLKMKATSENGSWPQLASNLWRLSLSMNRSTSGRQGKAALKSRALQTLARLQRAHRTSRSVWSASDLSALSSALRDDRIKAPKFKAPMRVQTLEVVASKDQADQKNRPGQVRLAGITPG